MEDSFYFSLLRISVAQILKASGFDKCKPLVLNTVTELYIKHLELVLSKAKKFALTRSNCTNEMLPQDLTQALLDVQLIKPLSFESILDPRDNAIEPEAEYNTKSLESLVRWLRYGDSYSLSKRLSEVPTALIHNLAEKRKIDISAETDQERKKRRLRERQEYYNQFKHGEENSQGFDRLVDDIDDDEITSNDKLSWLAYLAEKDLKLGHNLKFANTCILNTVMSVHKNQKFHPPSKNGEDSYQVLQNHLHNYNKNDYLVLHIQDADDKDENGISLQPSAQLKEFLPYNVKYSDALLNDDIQQYFKYADEHPMEIQKIRESIEEKGRKDPETNDNVPRPSVLGEEKPVLTVLEEVAHIDPLPQKGEDQAAEEKSISDNKTKEYEGEHEENKEKDFEELMDKEGKLAEKSYGGYPGNLQAEGHEVTPQEGDKRVADAKSKIDDEEHVKVPPGQKSSKESSSVVTGGVDAEMIDAVTNEE